MPVFRSKVRRRPARAQTRRRTSTRWAPPGFSPAAGVTLELATFHDTFSETTLKPWWKDLAVVYPHPDRSEVTTAGSGLSFNPASGNYVEVIGTYPFDLSRKSVTFDMVIDPAMLTTPTVYVEVALVSWPWILGVTDITAHVSFKKSGPDYIFQVRLNDSALITDYVVTSTSGWRFIKMSSDPTTPAVVTIYRSPDGYDWTQVGSTTITNTDITSVTLYAWGSADF